MGGSPELRLTRNEMCERLHVWEDELHGAPASGLHEWEVGEGLLYDDPAGGSHLWEDASDDVPDLEDGLDGFRDMDSDESGGESLPETNDQDEFPRGNAKAPCGTFDRCKRFLYCDVMGVAKSFSWP